MQWICGWRGCGGGARTNYLYAYYCILHYKLMTTSSREIIKRLQQEGWVRVRQKGTHTQWKHPEKSGRVTVPHPKRTLPVKTLKSIYRQAGWGKP